LILAAALFLPFPARSDAPAGAAPPDIPRLSIHARELRQWNARFSAGDVEAGDELGSGPDAPQASPLAEREASVGREVHGYHPYWMGGAYTSYEWSLLSTVAFFALELSATGDIVDDHGWPWTALVSTAHANGVRVIVTATLFSTAGLDQLLGSSVYRGSAISNLLDAVISGSADGVSVDFEGVPGHRKTHLVSFLGGLRDSLEAVIPDPYLTIATPAVDWSNAFDYDELAARCNHLMVMAYDYHWSGSANTGPVSPLAGWGTYNVSWTVADYQNWGAPPAKILLGVPYYAYRWPAVSGNAGAAALGEGIGLTYSVARTEADAHSRLWDSASSTPWYRYQSPGWFQGWYDDSTSLSAKYDLVRAEDLAGVGVWALGYDGARPELWSALWKSFGETTSAALTPSSHVVLANAGANPFRDLAQFRFSSFGPARLTIHDVAGRRLATIFESAGAVESQSASWNGWTERGHAAGTGVYFVRLESSGEARALRLVRLR
jgi:spore germination protein YaaH